MNAKPALVRPQLASEFDEYVALWVSRLSANETAALLEVNQGMYAEELRQLIGLTPLEGRLPRASLRSLLKTRANELAERSLTRNNILVRNVSMLAELVGLDSLQTDIVTIVALSQQHSLLAEVVSSIRTASMDSLVKVYAKALGHNEADVASALLANNLLLSTRILSIERSDVGRGLVLCMQASLVSALFRRASGIKDLMSSFLEAAPSTSLQAEHFSHLHQETELLTAYLSKAHGERALGVNILIYGPPGTGKTEYVRWLASKLRKGLYQVRSADNDGRPVDGVERLTYFQFSQHFLQKSNSIILFDEIEDVFPSNSGLSDLFSGMRNKGPGKMFINNLLETNPVPSIWVSNETEHIDKAYLRRFDFSFEMAVPPLSIRKKIIHGYLKHQPISDETLSYLSLQEELCPAQIEKASKVVKLACSRATEREEALKFVIENSMALLDQEKTDHVLNFTECSYRLDYLNPDCDVRQLVAQIKRSKRASGALCFYGAPGTGKTALAHYLAREVELPILARRASDILSSYVGETEQKIAEMFKQAKQEGALLLLDEADSFLSERKAARNSWEITAVNEMLTQMERFDGLFICSTNLMQKLDDASLRRFALKIKFDYLRPEQRWRLFIEQAKRIRRTQENDFRQALNQLSNLTPGDFATVRRQSSLLGASLTAAELLQRLQQECKNKRDAGSSPIGFIHA